MTFLGWFYILSAPNWANKNAITGSSQIIVTVGLMRLYALQKCHNQRALLYTVQSIYWNTWLVTQKQGVHKLTALIL